MRNKVIRILLAAVIAVALWTYVITVNNPAFEETFYNVPVNLRGESILNDRGLMITSAEIPKVAIKVSGNRSEVSKLSSENITLVADLSTIETAGVQTLSYSYAFPANVASDSVTVLDRSPGKITVTVERRITREIPVKLEYTGELPEDCIADKENVVLADGYDLPLENNTVQVTGPESVINQIIQAKIQVDLTGRSSSFSEAYQFALCDKDGEPVDAEQVTVETGEVYVTLNIQRVKEVPLVLEIIPGGGATEQTSQIDYEPKTIKVAGSDSVLADLTEVKLGTINLGEINGDEELVFQVELPDPSMTNLTGVTEVKVTVKFPELTTKSLVVTNMTAVNVPEGMEADIVTKELTVVVRGPKELIEKITEADISVSVDFTGAQAGTFTTKANIVMGEGYAECGAMGSYNVSATLRRGRGG